MAAEPRAFEARCSFCRKSNADVDVLIGAIGVYICNECVAVANDVLAKTPPSERKARDNAGEQLRGAPSEKLLRLVAGVWIASLYSCDSGQGIGGPQLARWESMNRGPGQPRVCVIPSERS